jgi:hypothetical protein
MATEGVLLKKQQLRKGWPERHFSLSGTTLQYRYPGSNRARTYSLTPQSTAECCVADGYQSFKISILSKAGLESMLLRPQSTKNQEQICQKWVMAIRAAIQESKGGKKVESEKAIVSQSAQALLGKDAEEENLILKCLPYAAIFVFLSLIPTTLALVLTSFALGVVATTFLMSKGDKQTLAQPVKTLSNNSVQRSSAKKTDGGENGTNVALWAKEAMAGFEYLSKAAADPEAEGWVAHATLSDVEIFLKKEGDYTFSLGKGIVDCPPHALYKALRDRSNKPQMDPNWKSTKIVCELDVSTVGDLGDRVVRMLQVEYSDFNRIFPTTARDFCGVVIETFNK